MAAFKIAALYPQASVRKSHLDQQTVQCSWGLQWPIHSFQDDSVEAFKMDLGEDAGLDACLVEANLLSPLEASKIAGE